MEKLMVFTAFSGYESQLMALDRLGIDYECVGWSEIDKYAIKAHNAIYPQYAERNYGDISKIDWEGVDDFDLFCYSFPCTDISNAGKQGGLSENSGTRSSLLWECRKAVEAKRPKYLLMENVKALVSKKFIGDFNRWCRYLSDLGYSNYWQVLNAKDYGVCQNRERVFMVSILGDEQYVFPKPFPLERRLKDVLDSEVEEKYYLSEHAQNGALFMNTGKKVVNPPICPIDPDKIVISNTLTSSGLSKANKQGTFIYQRGRGYNKGGIHDISPTISANSWEQNNKVIQVGSLKDTSNCKFSNKIQYRVYSAGGISPTLNTCNGGNREPKIVATTMCINSKDANGKQPSLSDRVYDSNGLSTAITVGWHPSVYAQLRIRKITPREVLRLMDVSEEDIDKMIAAGISNSQLYKLAGNSIVVSCLYYIFKELFLTKTQPKQRTLF